MKVFVTGGTGFIGSHLVDYLISHEKINEVRCLVRNQEKWLQGKNYQRVRGDLHNLPALKKGTEGVDVLFHLAGMTGAPNMRDFMHHNVDATENIVRTAIKNGITNIIVLSSLAATGPSFSVPVDEQDPLKPISMYGESKKRMEERLNKIDEEGVSIKMIRPPAVYGPRDEDIFTFFKIASKGICPMVGDGTYPKISMIYVEDVIQSIIKAVNFKEPGAHPFFVAGPQDYTWNQIKEATAEALGRKIVSIKLNPKWVKRLGKIAEKAGAMFGNYPVLNTEKANEMVMEWTCDDSKARKELGYQPRYSLQHGINRTIKWYQVHHWL